MTGRAPQRASVEAVPKPAQILVVDDEPGMLRAVERVLGRRHHLRCAATAREALSIAHALKPDVAILDVRMPDMDGFSLLAALKKEQPGLDVILMTGSVSEPDQKLIRSIRGNAFYFIQKPFDSEVLRTLVERCLELRRLAEDNRRHLQRLEAELAAARAFQRGLLPPEDALLEGASIACRYVPSSELGGDFYDYAPAGPGRVSFLIADVSGHGASAAMLTGMVKTAFHSAYVTGYEPLAVVRQVSGALASFGADQFVTLICARLGIAEQRLEYVNAGHPPAILWMAGREPVLLESTGPIISPGFPEVGWEQGALSLGAGEHILLYTDGIIEMQAPDDQLFGEERVLALVREHPHGGGSLLNAIIKTTRDFAAGRPQADDWTLVTVGWR